MDIALKHQIAEKIIQSDDEALLNEIRALVGLSERDFWADLPQEIKDAINEGKAELDRGEGIPHNEVMTDVRARFLKK